MPDKSVRGDIEILWKMARTNELYTFDMFYDDLMGKIRQIVEGCVPEKRLNINFIEGNVNIFINQTIDTMKANLERVWEGR